MSAATEQNNGDVAVEKIAAPAADAVDVSEVKDEIKSKPAVEDSSAPAASENDTKSKENSEVGYMPTSPRYTIPSPVYAPTSPEYAPPSPSSSRENTSKKFSHVVYGSYNPTYSKENSDVGYINPASSYSPPSPTRISVGKPKENTSKGHDSTSPVIYDRDVKGTKRPAETKSPEAKKARKEKTPEGADSDEDEIVEEEEIIGEDSESDDYDIPYDGEDDDIECDDDDDENDYDSGSDDQA